MITQFVNQIEHRSNTHPESLLVQATIMARIKRDTLSAITKPFHAIRAFCRKVSVRWSAADRNAHVQCGDMGQGCQETV
jgi:hypothetical protein